MTDKVVRNYTLEQRRLREALHSCRDLDSIKAWLDEHVVGEPVATSDFRPKTVDQRKDELRAQAAEQYQDTLDTGFTDANGITWQATQAARDRVLNLTQRIQEYRAGKMSTALPKGKDKARLFDADGNPQYATPDEIIALAEQGGDFKEDAADRLEQLLGEIAAATSHDELDAIDTSAGWPG